MEFFGHVHSSVWIAAGLIYLGRVTKVEKYINSGKRIYDYVRSLSSDYGWVPEFAQWKPMNEEHCETCCLKDMILCARELVECGYSEHWNDINLIARNQLTENQVKYTGYVVSDDTLPDKDGKTYHHLAERIIGGYTGGSEPNSISISRFRSIAGCCVGTAPIALGILWENTVTKTDGIYTEASAGDVLTLLFEIKTVVKKEFFAGCEYTEYWHGGDMIDIEPKGGHIRLYQRDNEKEKYYPLPDDVTFTGSSDRGPTQMSPNM